MSNHNLYGKPEPLLDLPFLFILALLFISVFAFNNVITFDSHVYYKLSQQVASSWEEWDMLRTPIVPTLLATMDEILGN